MLKINEIYNMNCLDGLKLLDDKSINCCVTSPPYYALRDYGIESSVWPTVKYYPMTGVPYEIEAPEWNGCLGLEPTIEMFIAHMVLIFREVKRVLKDDGTLWLNFGDSYAGSGKGAWSNKTSQKEVYVPDSNSPQCKIPKVPKGLKVKDLMGIPWRVAFALQTDGWYLRMDNIWNKPSCMPEAVKDRTTKAHEYMFLLSKNKKYYYDSESIKEPCVNGDPNPPRGSVGVIENLNKGRRLKGNAKTFRGGGAYTQGQSFNNSAAIKRESHGNKPNELELRNKRSVWTVATDKFNEAHFATFPPKLIEPCILAGCPVDGVVLDTFMGSGTVAAKALELQRNFIGFEINPEYKKMSEEHRLKEVQIRIV